MIKRFTVGVLFIAAALGLFTGTGDAALQWQYSDQTNVGTQVQDCAAFFAECVQSAGAQQLNRSFQGQSASGLWPLQQSQLSQANLLDQFQWAADWSF